MSEAKREAATPAKPLSPEMAEGMAALQRIIQGKTLINAALKDHLQENVHFGKIPGTDKKVLLKTGADTLASLFQLRLSFQREVVDHEGGHREVVIKCVVANRDGEPISEAHGSCSTLEPRYRYRNADRVCPECGAAAIKASKHRPGFYCFKKIGGCGATFFPEDERVTSQPVGKVPTADPAEYYNTVLKMAEKRAETGAIIRVTGCGDIFSQDVESLPDFAEHFVEDPASPDGARPRAASEPKEGDARAARPARVDDVLAKMGLEPNPDSRRSLGDFLSLIIRQLQEKGKTITFQGLLDRGLANPDDLRRTYGEYLKAARPDEDAAQDGEGGPAEAPEASEAAQEARRGPEQAEAGPEAPEAQGGPEQAEADAGEAEDVPAAAVNG
jgi:hypothetical protein